MSEIKINWNGHVKKYQNAMNELNLDFCVLTRIKSITYLTGAFVPWRSAIFLPKEGAGEPILYTVLLDVERCRAEGQLQTEGWGPMKGFYLEKKIQSAAKKYIIQKVVPPESVLSLVKIFVLVVECFNMEKLNF